MSSQVWATLFLQSQNDIDSHIHKSTHTHTHTHTHTQAGWHTHCKCTTSHCPPHATATATSQFTCTDAGVFSSYYNLNALAQLLESWHAYILLRISEMAWEWWLQEL